MLNVNSMRGVVPPAVFNELAKPVYVPSAIRILMLQGVAHGGKDIVKSEEPMDVQVLLTQAIMARANAEGLLASIDGALASKDKDDLDTVINTQKGALKTAGLRW